MILLNPDSKADDATKKAWKKADAKVMGALVLSVVPSLRMSLEHHHSAKEIWKYLEQRYLQPSGALRFSLLQSLHNLQQQDMFIEEYYGAFTRITSQLVSMTPKRNSGCESCVAKEKHEQQTFMFQFVMGLRQEFEYSRTQLLGCPTLPTLDDALARLIAEETRLRSLVTPTASMTHTSVLASQHRGSSSGDVVCSYCKKSGHTYDRCFALHPELLAEYRKRFPLQQRRGSTRRPSTTAAFESGPSAKSASVSAASQSASGAVQPWVLDSGASFHVTSDCSQLVSCQPVKDGPSIQTADGSSEQKGDWYWPSP